MSKEVPLESLDTNTPSTCSITSPTSTPITLSKEPNNSSHDQTLYQLVGSQFPLNHHNKHTFVTCFSNIHGLRTRHTPLCSSLHDLTASTDDMEISVLGLSEHQLSLKDSGIAQMIHQFTRSIRARTPIVCHLDSSNETSAGTGRLMGGTGVIATKTTIGQITKNGLGGDAMGRWSYIHLKRHQKPPVTIISIYQVCINPTNPIGSTAWHQQRRALDQANRSTTHPRTAFIDDLISFITSLQRDKHDIIVGGDWNDYLNAPNSSLVRLCTTLQLVDPWLTHFPENPSFATHERGTQRIDSVLVSHSLLQTITTLGYSPVGLISSSDHRSLFISFSTERLFGQNPTSLNSPSQRSVRSNDKQSVTTFVESMYSHLIQHNVFERAKQLLPTEPDLVSHQVNLVEAIDSIIGQAGDLGERKCHRRRPEWYSIAIVRQRLTVSYLRHYLQGLRWGRNRSEVILTKLRTIESPINELPVSRSDAQTLLSQHTTILKTMKENSRSLRTQHLSSLHSATSSKINRHEIAMTTWRTIRYLKATTTTSTLDQLEIPANWPPPFTPMGNIRSLPDPKATSEWQLITSASEIEYYLQLRNRLHFGQAKVTPFAQPDLQSIITWGADTDTVEDILSGTYIPPESVPLLCKTILLNCKHLSISNLIQPAMTLESFRGKIRKWRESTTTSPSGRHLGRYKALFAKGIYDSSTPDETTAFSDKQAAIVTVLLTIINFCISSGHVLHRWQVVVNR
jgi:hypothetical protein